jgi:transcriptional regulator with XRE-family HTH domain
MPRRSPSEAIDAARLLLVEYYVSQKRRYTLEWIARKTGLSRATVSRLAKSVRDALPTVTALQQQLEALERRIERLEGRLEGDLLDEAAA